MTRLLNEIDWAQPLLPPSDDPEWSAELVRVYGVVAPPLLYAARSPWVRRAMLHVTQIRIRHAPERQGMLAILVTSQENACRFCYGAARSYLKMLGLDDAELERIERDVKLAGADENERAVLRFCRNLSRSNPRPARSELEALVARGLAPLAMVEIAVIVATTCFNNRVATFLAVPLDAGLEQFSPGAFQRLTSAVLKRLGRGYPRPLAPPRTRHPDAQFSEILKLAEGTEGAFVLEEALHDAFASPVLPVRTKAWVFAVVARALGCKVSEQVSTRLLDAEGVSASTRERILGSLAGPELDPTESVLLPWVRETAHYQTEVMQRRTHELRGRVSDDILIEAIGLASLANACARLSMLAQ